MATAHISGRDAGNSWTVTSLDGEVSNPSPTDARVTTLYVQFKPGIPPDVHTAELTVSVDLAVAAGASAHWVWTGSILVRPFHDDAPQPEVDEIDWTWADPNVQERCDNQPG